MKHHTAIEHLESRIAPAGLVLAVYDSRTHELTITGDDLDNKIAIFQTSKNTWRVEGRATAPPETPDDPTLDTSINEDGETQFDVGKIAKLTITTAGGNDRVEIVNLYGIKSMSVDTGAGNDTVKTEGFAAKGNVTFNTGAGLDVVEFDGLIGKVGGDLNIVDSAGGLLFEFRAEQARVGGHVKFTGSAAVDTLSMTTDTMLTIGKGIDFTANGGNDRVTFGSEGTVTIGRDAAGRSVNYHGGDGNDRIAIDSSIVTLLGSVEMSGGAGNDTLDIDGLRVSIGKSAAGISALLVGDVGKNKMDIQGSTVIAAGLLRLDGGPGEDLLDLSSVHRLILNGGTHFEGGAAFDEFRIGADYLRVKGDLFFDGGDDGDEAEIEANGVIRGSVILHLGGAQIGDQIAAVLARSGMRDALNITGSLTIDATGDSTANDDIKLTSLKLDGALSVTLGDGTSSLDMDNDNIAGTVMINTRGGADEVSIEGDGNFGVSSFRKQTTILMGAGDDILVVGEDSEDNLVRFFRNVTVDGGDGTDTRNALGTDNEFADSATYTETAFEILLPPSP